MHLITSREAASLTFAKLARGDIAVALGIVVSAAEFRRQRELCELSLPVSSIVLTTDLLPLPLHTMSQLGLENSSIGVDKRCMFRHFLDTEEVSAEVTETMTPDQQPQSNICILPNVTYSILTPVGTLSPSGTTASVAAVAQSPCISTGTFIPQQYMAARTMPSGLGQPAQMHTSAVLPKDSTYSTLSAVPYSQPLVIQIDSKCPRRIYHVSQVYQSVWIKHYICHLSHEAHATGNNPFCRPQNYEYFS